MESDRILVEMDERAPDQRKRAQTVARPRSSVPRRPTVRMLKADTKALLGWIILGCAMVVVAFFTGYGLGWLFLHTILGVV